MVRTKLLITFDAREWAIGRSKEYIVPVGVEKVQHYNFYQVLPFRGWKVKKAVNARIHWTSHPTLPGKAFPNVMKIINGLQ